MASNDKTIKSIHKTLGKHMNNLKNNFKKMRILHHKIKHRGVYFSKIVYNNELKKYGKMVKKYNENRKRVCARLPPLWALVNKKKTDYTLLEVKCKKWFYQGQVLGGNIANAFFKISFYRYNQKKWLTDRLKCINRMLNYKKAVNRTQAHLRGCYNRGYHYQMNRTLFGLHVKNRKLTIFRRPFRSYRLKKKELAKTLRSLKN